MTDWHKFPDELPPEDGYYLITAHDWGDTLEHPWPYIDYFDSESGEFRCQDWIRSEGWCVIAWAPCPLPYRETDRSSQTS